MRLLETDRAITTRGEERTRGREGGCEQEREWAERERALTEGEIRYSVRPLAWNDVSRQAAYQRLRGEVFVGERGWDLPLDGAGRESDRYDIGGGQAITSYAVSAGIAGGDEELLGGVRVFTLRHWDDSMLRHEFLSAGMIPHTVLDELETRSEAQRFVELTRLCVRTRRAHAAAERESLTTPSYDLGIARDLVYAGAYAAAEAAGRRYALGVTDGLYLRVMRRSHFVFDTLFDGGMHARGGYGLVLIDLVATVRAIHARGETARAQRMLLGCRRRWL